MLHTDSTRMATRERLAGTPAPVRIELLSGPMDGLEFEFYQLEVAIGRGESNDVCLAQDLLVSRHHAVLTVDDSGLWIEDSMSTNGTFVEEQRLTGKTGIGSGDIVKAGLTEMRISLGAPGG
jgi:pSer/pThr/pTyr-binding forkhead associated (FHA) protein